jgi:NTP pyrophosphatase (non-canonical NTP hydrolase)
MSLTDAQQRVDAWISQYEEGYFQPLTNLARLAEEVGELAREVNHRFGQKTKKRDEAEGDLAMEMADILFVLICMANREGIDLQAGFDRMMAKVETRDRERWTRKGGQAVGQTDRRTGGLADRRSGGQVDRRSVQQADGWADDR